MGVLSWICKLHRALCVFIFRWNCDFFFFFLVTACSFVPNMQKLSCRMSFDYFLHWSQPPPLLGKLSLSRLTQHGRLSDAVKWLFPSCNVLLVSVIIQTPRATTRWLDVSLRGKLNWNLSGPLSPLLRRLRGGGGDSSFFVTCPQTITLRVKQTLQSSRDQVGWDAL